MLDGLRSCSPSANENIIWHLEGFLHLLTCFFGTSLVSDAWNGVPQLASGAEQLSSMPWLRRWLCLKESKLFLGLGFFGAFFDLGSMP